MAIGVKKAVTKESVKKADRKPRSKAEEPAKKAGRKPRSKAEEPAKKATTKAKKGSLPAAVKGKISKIISEFESLDLEFQDLTMHYLKLKANSIRQNLITALSTPKDMDELVSATGIASSVIRTNIFKLEKMGVIVCVTPDVTRGKKWAIAEV